CKPRGAYATPLASPLAGSRQIIRRSLLALEDDQQRVAARLRGEFVRPRPVAALAQRQRVALDLVDPPRQAEHPAAVALGEVDVDGPRVGRRVGPHPAGAPRCRQTDVLADGVALELPGGAKIEFLAVEHEALELPGAFKFGQ